MQRGELNHLEYICMRLSSANQHNLNQANISSLLTISGELYGSVLETCMLLELP